METLAKLSLWALALIPLVVLGNVSTAFSKMTLVRLLLLLVSGLFFFLYVTRSKFRQGSRAKIAAAIRNPLVLAVLAFVGLAVVSTALAVSPFRAFFGNVERSEGLIGLLCYFGFFVYSYLLFNHEDWLTFFKINIAVGLISFIQEINELLGGTARPKAFTGNTEYLAGYLLFVIFCAAVVFIHSPKKTFWRYAAMAGGVAAIAGIGFTQTRGALLGLAAAAAVLTVCGLVCGQNVKLFGRVTARTAALVLIILAVAGGGLFLATKDAVVWQKVPGISRLVKPDRDSANSISTRMIALNISARAVTQGGLVRGLLGYGPDNFNIAFNRFYDPTFYKYEHGWFDRAHNKLADVAVMNGLLGLLAYLAIWVALIYLVFRRRPVSPERLAVLLFAAAYFGYLMTVFDQISTYIPFFVILAFMVTISTASTAAGSTAPPPTAATKAATKKERRALAAQAKAQAKSQPNTPKNPADIIAFGLVGAALAWVAVVWTLIPFSQVSSCRAMIDQAATDPAALADIDSVFSPYNYAQQDVRTDFLRNTSATFNKSQSAYNLFLKAIAKMDEAETKESLVPMYLLQAGIAYDQKEAVSQNPADWKRAESYYRRALVLAPRRQEVAYALAANLVYQNRVDEALSLMRQEVAADSQAAESHFYLGFVMSRQGEDQSAAALVETEQAFNMDLQPKDYPPNSAAVYKKFARYFYAARDQARFVTAMKRLSVINPGDKAKNDTTIQAVENGSWPDIEIK